MSTYPTLLCPINIIGISSLPSSFILDNFNVIVHSTTHKKLKPKYKYKKVRKAYLPSNRLVIKLSANNLSVYRMVYSYAITKVTGKEIVLSAQDFNILDLTHSPTNVEVTKGNKFMFYWQHPDHAVRASLKLGIISLSLGILAIAIAVSQYFI